MNTGRQVNLSFIIILCLVGSSLWAQTDSSPADGDKTVKISAAKPDDIKDASATKIADDDVVISVNGKELKKWELDVLMKHKPGLTHERAADNWVDIQLRAEEARRRGLDKGKESEFLMQLHKDFCLGLLLGHAVVEEVQDISDQEARMRYERDIKQYKRPFKATLQHVTIKDEQEAKKAAEEARAPGAIFNNISQPSHSKSNVRGFF